ncbi:MAG: hypothetical protein WCL06_06635 [Bacteroidota bacterium]
MKFTLTLHKVLFTLLVLLAPAWGWSQNIGASATIDTNNVLIGDHIKYTYKATFPAKAQVLFPIIGDTLSKQVDVISLSKIDTVFSADKKMVSYSQTLNITSFDSGSIVVPALVFTYTMPGDTTRLSVNTLPVVLNINTVAVDTTQAIKDIKAPMKEPITLREIIIWSSIILGSLLLIALIIFIIWKVRKKEAIIKISLKPKIPAHEKALKELEKLRSEKLWQSGKVKEFHTILIDILRAYIEERFETIALEMTTYEIITSLKTKLTDTEELKKLEQILSLADMVKFAKYNPLPDEHDNSLNRSVSFVENTKLVKTDDTRGTEIATEETDITNESKTE